MKAKRVLFSLSVISSCWLSGASAFSQPPADPAPIRAPDAARIDPAAAQPPALTASQARRVEAFQQRVHQTKQALVAYEVGRQEEAIEACRAAGLEIVEIYGPGNLLVCKWQQPAAIARAAISLDQHPSIRRIDPNVVMQLDPAEMQAVNAAAVAQGRMMGAFYGGVQAQPRTPNDPRFGDLLGMTNARAPEAWGRVQTTKVIVAVSDTGIDYNHQDLKDNMWVNPFEIPGDGLDNDGNGYVDDVHGINAITGTGDPMDDNSHGTHCAGTIGAVGNNHVGVAGVCWKVQLMGCKWIAGSGSGTVLDAIKSIDYAWQNNAKIISASWRFTEPRSVMGSLREAIDRARVAGVVFVAAAGNENYDIDLRVEGGQPAAYPAGFAHPSDTAGFASNMIVVASIDAPTETRSSFSVWGRKTVHLAAVGRNVLSTVPGNGYAFFNGTSMATPHVAGACALLLGHRDFDNADVRGIKGRLLSNSRRLPGLKNLIATEGALDLTFLGKGHDDCVPLCPCWPPCPPCYPCYPPCPTWHYWPPCPPWAPYPRPW